MKATTHNVKYGTIRTTDATDVARKNKIPYQRVYTTRYKKGGGRIKFYGCYSTQATRKLSRLLGKRFPGCSYKFHIPNRESYFSAHGVTMYYN